MKERDYKSVPYGAVNQTLPKAAQAEHQHSAQLVKDQEEDAFYFRALEGNGIYLNRSQIEAVRHFNGPLLTIAGAGSGKTSVLVCRTGYLISVKQIMPRHLLLVTFTKKAADEMKERLATLPGLKRSDAFQVQARTFHSFFLILLKSLGYNQEILANERYKQVVMTRLLKDKGLEDAYQPETLLLLLSHYKMNMISLEQIPSTTKSDKEVKAIFQAFETWKTKNQQLDFDDILLEAYLLLKKSPDLLKNLQERFHYIMVDEFQDTNLLQYELIKMLVHPHHNLFVVGDDDQTIYSFNGARNEILLNFDKSFPNCKSIILDINYRSTQPILGLGNQVIQYNKERKTKTLKATKESSVTPQFSRPASTDEEAEHIVQKIKDKVAKGDCQYRDFAILHRTSNNSRAIFEQLALADLPFIDYTTGYTLFYEQWPVKALISYLRAALDPRNMDAIADILPTLYVNRDLGMFHLMQKNREQPKKFPLIHLTSLPRLKEFQIVQIKDRMKLIQTLVSLKPVSAIKELRKDFYDRFLNTERNEQPTLVKESIKEALDELETSAKRFETLPSFLEFVDRMIEKHKAMNALKKGNQDAIHLMTIHRSKGLEFPVVYVIGASDGILPHSTALDSGKMDQSVSKKPVPEQVEAAIEEERRLLYVAITRAMNELYISSPAFYRGKKAEVSRFLLEAYGKRSSQTVQTPNKRKHSKEKQREETYKVTVLAWICSSDQCNGWQRILTHDEAEIEHKTCPICHSAMHKGAIEIN